MWRVVSPLLQRLSQQKSKMRTDLDTIPVLLYSCSWPWKIYKILSGFGSLTQCNARTLYHNDHCTYTYWISWADVWHQPHLGWRRGLPRLDSADNLSWTADPPTYRERDRQERSNLTRQQWRSSFMVMLLLHSWGYLTHNGLLACMAGQMYGQLCNCIDLLPPPLLFWG